MVVRIRRPRETAPGHSQKIEAKCCRKLRLEKVVTNTSGCTCGYFFLIYLQKLSVTAYLSYGASFDATLAVVLTI